MELPIVATDIAGCRGLVREGVNGFLVPVKSVEPLADALEKLIIDNELRKRMGGAGRQIVLTEFDQIQVNTKTINIFHELLKLKYNSRQLLFKVVFDGFCRRKTSHLLLQLHDGALRCADHGAFPAPMGAR